MGNNISEVVERILVVDCQTAGISGDMLVGALIDLGANREKIVENMELVKDYLGDCRAVKVLTSSVLRHDLRATRLDIRVDEDFDHRTGAELMEAVSRYVKGLKLPKRVQKFSQEVMKTILQAEARVHGTGVDEVHLHETGSADTLADIIGAAIALKDLGLLEENVSIYSTPVAVGGGLFKFSHGIASSPAPATLEILREGRFSIIGGPVEAELATPTGVALLVNLVASVNHFYPSMTVEKIGYGAGAKDFKEVPNILRVSLGKRTSTKLFRDEICVLETNIDDASGEVLGHAIDKLFAEGAKDVSIIPATTKKNRPAYIVKVIADKERAEDLSWTLIRETGTIGVRTYLCQRFILKREVFPIEVEFQGVKERVRIKVAKDREGRIVQIKPEYDDVKNLAERTGIPLREALEYTLKKAKETLK